MAYHCTAHQSACNIHPKVLYTILTHSIFTADVPRVPTLTSMAVLMKWKYTSSQKQVPGQWSNTECVLLLHNTVVSEGSH